MGKGMDILLEIFLELLSSIVESLGDLAPEKTNRIIGPAMGGCVLVIFYLLIMGVAIGMGIWVLPVNKPAGIALIIVGALLAIGTLIAFLKFFFRRNK